MNASPYESGGPSGDRHAIFTVVWATIRTSPGIRSPTRICISGSQLGSVAGKMAYRPFESDVGGKKRRVEAGSVVYIPSNVVHSTKVVGDRDVVFFTCKDTSHGLHGIKQT